VNIWQEWLQNTEANADPALPKRIQQMHKGHGKREGVTCKTCRHLRRLDYHNSRYLKCDLTKITHGAATDWRAGWPACGKYEEGEE
jgi:hypothetical protein